jgi:hypothetical protein
MSTLSPVSCTNDRREATIPAVQISSQRNSSTHRGEHPFAPGAIVIVTLGNPRDKFWGAVVALTPEGISLCGIELASFEDFVSLVKDGEPFSPGIVFFPMHRVERMELDMPDAGIPSLSQRFARNTGRDPAALLVQQTPRHPTPEDSR